MARKIQHVRLRMYLDAERAVLSGQSYQIGNRQLTRANLKEIQKAINDLIAGGATLDGSDADTTGTSKRVLFIDNH